MRVLTWNLFHGRAVPPAGRDLRGEFAAALAGWDWDVALLQEVPPWWPPRARRAPATRSAHRADLAQRAAAAAPRDRASAGPTSSSPTAAAPTRSSCAARRDRRAPPRRAALLARAARVPRACALGERRLGRQPPRPGALRGARPGRHRARRGRRRSRWAGGAPACSAATSTCAGRSRRASTRRRARRRPRPRSGLRAAGQPGCPTAAACPTTRR